MAGDPVGDRTDRIHKAIGDRLLHNGLDAMNLSGRYLLVQSSTHDGGLWLTAFDSPQRAAAYLDDEEYPHDWDTETMVDLETGASFSPVVTTRWEPAAP